MGNAQHDYKGGKTPTKHGTKGSKAKPLSSDFRYVNYTPTQQDKQRLRAMDFSGVDLIEWLSELLPDGYKASLSAKWEGDPGESPCTYTASLTGVSASCANAGLILTARGGDAATALVWLYYLHNVVFDRNWVKDEMGGWDLDVD